MNSLSASPEQNSENNLHPQASSEKTDLAKFLQEITEICRGKTLLLLPQNVQSQDLSGAMIHSPQSVKEKSEKKADKSEKKEASPSQYFAEFMEGLEKDKSSESADKNGFIWSDLPLEDLVSDGLWLIMQKLSQKYKLRLTTDKEVTEKMATLVNYLVSLGLVATYGKDGAQKAVVDFQKEVVEKVQASLVKQTKNQPLDPQELWQVQSGQFFAKLISNARERIKYNIYWLGKLIEENWHNPIDEIVYSDPFVGDIKGLYKSMQEGQKAIEVPQYDVIDDPKYWDLHNYILANYRLDYEKEAENLKLLKKLPVRGSQIPRDARLEYFTIDIAWINTQLISTIIGSDKEYVNQLDLTKAIKAVDTIDSEKIIAETLAKWKSRGMKVSPEEEIVLIQKLESKLKQLRRNLYPGAPINSDVMSGEFIYRLEKLDAEENQEVSSTTAQEKISLEDFERMVAKEEIDLSLVVERYLLSFKGDELKNAVDMLLSMDLDMPVINALCKQELVSIKDARIYALYEELDQDWLKKHHFELIDKDSTENHLVFWHRIILTFDQPTFTEICNDARSLEELSGLLLKLKLYQDNLLVELRDRLGKEKCLSILLNHFLVNSEFEYANDKDSSFTLDKWDSPDFASTIAECTGLEVEEVQEYLQKNTEEAWFAKMYSHEKSYKTKLKKFLKNREVYYAKRANQEPSTEAQQSKAATRTKKPNKSKPKKA